MGNSQSSQDKEKLKIVGAVTGGIVLGALTFGTAAVIIGTTGAIAKGATEYIASSQGNGEGSSSNRACFSSGGSTSMSKAGSPVWQGLKPFRGEIRTNGLSGSSRSYFTWDYTHCNIEKFNHIGKHMGSVDPVSGNICKSAVPGRSIKL